MATQESILRILIDSRNAERNANSLNRELRGIERNGDFASNSMDSMSSASRKLAASLASVVTVGAAISKMDAYTALQNRLKLVTASQQDLNTAMDNTFQIAQNTAQAWDSVAMVYQRFADNAKALGITLEQTASLTETVSKAIAVSGGSAASAEAALMQFGQALASGVLRGEEFNSIAEQAPALLKAIASGLNVGIGELRAMAADGKITGEVIVSSLEKSKKSVDDLFGKTDFSIGNSFTQLNNAIIQFTGEAGKASGSAAFLSNAIKTLADNLSLVANVAVLGGIALLTKAIATKTVAVKASIATSIQRRAADEAEIQSQLRLSGLEVQRTRRVAALALTEVDLARKEYNSARTRTERAAATMRLTQAEVALAVATRQVGIATAADTALQNANTAARSRAAMALGLVGGPIGALVLGVTALSAGYMYMSRRAAEANKKLEEQADVAKRAKEELMSLKGIDRDNAIDKMAASFERQNKALSESSSKINMQLNAIEQLYKGNKEVSKVVQDARNGTISMTDAVKRFNELRISKDVYESVKANTIEFEKNAREATNTKVKLNLFGYEVELAGRKAQTAVAGLDENSRALKGNKSAAEDAANAQSKFIESLKKTALQTDITNKLIEKGWNIDRAKLTANALVENNNKVSASDILAIDRKLAGDKKLKASEDALAKSQKDRTKSNSAAKKKENKDAERLLEQQYNDRERIYYEYATKETKIAKDLENEIKLIQSARFSPNDEAGYIKNAQNRAGMELEIYNIQLDQELNDWNSTELEKLDRKVRLNEMIIRANSDMSDKIKSKAMKSLIEQSNFEAAEINLNKELRMFQDREFTLNSIERINERYELELQKIALIRDAEERNHAERMAAMRREKDLQDEINRSKGIIGVFMNGRDKNEFEALDDETIQAMQASEDLYIAELSRNYENREELLQEHKDRIAEIEAKSREKSMLLQLSYGEQITGSFASMFGTMMGEQSRAYKIMFAAEKAFAIASSVIAIQKGIAQASSLAFPYNLAAMATVASQTASIVANIKSVADVGFQSGGYTGNGGVSDIAGVVHGKEYVLNAEATKRVGVGTLNAINSGASVGGGITVNIVNNGTPQTYDVQQIDENTVKIIATDIVNQEVTRQLASPNSPISKGIKQNFNTGNRRG